MPSATATRPRRLAWSRKSSSLPSRTRPTSLTPSATSLKGLTACSRPPGRSLDDLRDRLAEMHLVSPFEARHAVDLLAVHVGAVGRAEVLDVPLAVLLEQPGVQLGDVRVVVEHESAPTAAPDRDLAVDRVRLAPTRGGLEDAEPQCGAGLVATLPSWRRGRRDPRRLGRARGGAQLPPRQPHHPVEGEGQQGEEAELEDREYGFGHEVRP